MFTFYSSQWIEDGYLLGQCDSNTLHITLIVYIQQWSPVVTVMDVTVRIMMMMVIIVTLQHFLMTVASSAFTEI